MRIVLLKLVVLSALMQYSIAQEKNDRDVKAGIIIDALTYLPIDGATISFFPVKQFITTDEQGKFLFKNSPEIDTILITGVGYESKKIPYTYFVLQNTIALNPQSVQLSSVTVSARGGDHSKTMSKLDIRIRGLNNSQEVLRIVPGLFIGQHAGGGKAEQIFLRGFDIDHGTDINITVDGMPVNLVSHAHGQGYADLHFVIPELIENVYFQKGPYSTERGNLATSGFVDFRTKNGLSSNQVKLEAGEFNTFRGVGMFNLLGKKITSKQQSAYIASEYMYTKGYFESPQNFNRINLFGKYYAKLNQNNTFNFSASTFSSKWRASGQIPERAVKEGLITYFGAIDPNEGGHTTRTNINAQLHTALKNGDYLKNQLYYSYYDFELYSNFTFFNVDSINGDQIKQMEKRNLFGYNGSYTRINYLDDKKITTEIGGNIRLDKTKGSELTRTRDRMVVINPVQWGDIDELNTTIYINEAIRLNEQFSLNGGLRWDYLALKYKDRLNGNKMNKANAGILSPKLNFFYHVNRKTELYLRMGKGFHSNDTRVVIQKQKQIVPAAYGADFGIIVKPIPNLLLNGTIWYLHLDQEFVYVGDEGIVEPSGKSRRFGIDLSVRYQPLKWFFFDADCNYSRARAIDEPKGANHLPLAPVLTSVGGITIKTKSKFNGSFRYRFMDDRPANRDKSLIAEGYFINDIVLNYTMSKFEFGVSIQNLFDVRWKETQFDTESRLKNEPQPISEIHFTPGTPFFIKGAFTYFF